MSQQFNFLRGFTELLRKTEVPPRFALWCGISTLLAALERRVWINQGIYSVYPNFYFVLVAASGQKKSTAINKTANLLRHMQFGPNVISQKITPEALVGALQQKSEITDARSSNPKKTCGGIVIADELATFLDRQSLERGLGPMLTALYDCTPFEYQTLKRGVERIEGGYLSILGGTTIELLKNALPKDAIGGGFTSRTVFIYEDKVPEPVAWIDYDEALVELEGALVAYLERLVELKGPVQLTPQARDLYISIYNQRHQSGSFRTDPGLQNYENRRHAHLLTVAMALMVAEHPNLVLEEKHLRGAEVILSEAEEYLPRVIELITATDVGMLNNVVLQWILAQPKATVTRTALVRQFSHRIDAREITGVLDVLRQSCRIEVDSEAGKIIYRAVRAGR